MSPRVGDCRRGCRQVVVKNDGWRRALKAIHAPPTTISSAPTSTVGGVLAGPIVASYTRPKGYMNTGALGRV